MAHLNANVTRIIGGKEPQPTTGDARYVRPLTNTADQDVSETLTVGTTYRMFRGPRGAGPHWSYHVNCTEAGGAASQINWYYSNLPHPDPANTAHWHTSGVAATVLTGAAEFFASVTGATPEWILAEIVVAVNTADAWAYVRVASVDE
jgi:hypothetical protein